MNASLSDFVRMLFVAAHRQKIPILELDDLGWGTLLWNLRAEKSQPGKPNMLDSLTFSWDYKKARCDQLRGVLSELHSTDLFLRRSGGTELRTWGRLYPDCHKHPYVLRALLHVVALLPASK